MFHTLGGRPEARHSRAVLGASRLGSISLSETSPPPTPAGPSGHPWYQWPCPTGETHRREQIPGCRAPDLDAKRLVRTTRGPVRPHCDAVGAQFFNLFCDNPACRGLR